MKKGGTKAVNILIVIGLNVVVAAVLALLLLYVFSAGVLVRSQYGKRMAGAFLFRRMERKK